MIGRGASFSPRGHWLCRVSFLVLVIKGDECLKVCVRVIERVDHE